MAALRHGLSVYDGCYLALAETRGATLVTANRRLAAAATHAERRRCANGGRRRSG